MLIRVSRPRVAQALARRLGGKAAVDAIAREYGATTRRIRLLDNVYASEYNCTRRSFAAPFGVNMKRKPIAPKIAPKFAPKPIAKPEPPRPVGPSYGGIAVDAIA